MWIEVIRGYLVILNGTEPESLDPAVMTGQADLRIGHALFEGLTRLNSQRAEPEPGLAEDWVISDKGKVYTFHLRTNAFWSTGARINAEDFVFSWLRVLDPATAGEYAGLLFPVKGAEDYHLGRRDDPSEVGLWAPAHDRLVVTLRQATPYFLQLCALPTLAVVPREAIDRHQDRWLFVDPVPTSGAYCLDRWVINDRIRLRRNNRYWDNSNTQSDVVDLLPCTSANVALNLYESGMVDIVWDKNLVPSDLLDVLLERPDFHVYPVLGTYFIRINVTRPPFDDVRVRRALALAVDKERLVRKITRGGEQVANALTPPGVPGYKAPDGLRRDAELARRLLAEAGYPNGKGFRRFDYLFDTSSPLQEQIAIELQDMWETELGLSPVLRRLEWKTYLAAQGDLDYDLCRSSWIGDYNDPNTFLDLFMSDNGNNRTGWRNPGYDQLMREANGIQDRGRRAGELQRAEALLVAEEIPVIPLYFYSGLEYYDPNRIRGVYPNLLAEHPIRSIQRVAESVVPLSN